jgi:tetratricopeptide (TPR) repeat protein
MSLKPVAVALGCILVVFSATFFAFHTWGTDNREVEQFLCQYFYLCADERLAQQAQQDLWRGDRESLGRAVSAYGELLRRDPASPFRWADLGDALVRGGDEERARYCHERATALGPHSPPILLRAAHFYYQVNEDATALQLLGQILRTTREYDELIFSLHERTETRSAHVLEFGMPQEAEALESYFQHLLSRGDPTTLTQTWDWMSTRSLATDPSLNQYLDFLLRAKEYDAALDTLAGYLDSLGRHRRIGGNLVLNPGFEHEPLGTALDWSIRASIQFETTRDAEVFRTGSWSLRVRFSGLENVEYQHLTQRIIVEPGRYRFRAQVRTIGVTTDQGIGFRIAAIDGTSRLNVETEPREGTSEWMAVETTFIVPRRTRLLEIQAFRRLSQKFDSRIDGTVWIDDVSVVRQ